MHQDVVLIAAYAERTLPLPSALLSDEYFYQSLPLCVIDAVYSIGVRYTSVQRVVSRYCERYSLRRFRLSRHTLPTLDEQEPIRAFCDKAEALGTELLTLEVFRNRQRTSTRGGILKADAVVQFAHALRDHGVDYLQDIPEAAKNSSLEKSVRCIPGQTSGIALQYFWMLAGSDEFVKPDRMVLRFLESALNRAVSTSESLELLKRTCEQLSNRYPVLTPRLLDHEIWKYQQQQTP